MTMTDYYRFGATYTDSARPHDALQRIVGDHIVTATIHCDYLTNVEDSDCYTQQQLDWYNAGMWYYIGIVITVTDADGKMMNVNKSLWGLELGLVPQGQGAFLTSVANELLIELQDEHYELNPEYQDE